MLAGRWFISGIETFGLIALLIGVGLWLRNRPIAVKNDAAPVTDISCAHEPALEHDGYGAAIDLE